MLLRRLRDIPGRNKSWAQGLGEKGAYDNQSAFTPNILAYKGKYYLYYTGLQLTPGNVNGKFENIATNDFTAIDLAVADSPDGPFVRVKNNTALKISQVPDDFDSYRNDDAPFRVKDSKIWLYYK